MAEAVVEMEVDGGDVRDLGATVVVNRFSVNVLQLIKEAQSQHGLRHGDYQRYRSCYPSFLVFKGVLYCFRKVCTLLLLFGHLIDITRTVLG
jgi:hypothetical protein